MTFPLGSDRPQGVIVTFLVVIFNILKNLKHACFIGLMYRPVYASVQNRVVGLRVISGDSAADIQH